MNWRNKPRRNLAFVWDLFSLLFAYLLLQLCIHLYPKLTLNSFWISPLGYTFTGLLVLFAVYLTTGLWIRSRR